MTLRISRWKCSVSSMILIFVIAVVVEPSVVVNIIIVDLFSGGLKPFLIYIWTLSALLIPWHRIGLIFLYPSLSRPLFVDKISHFLLLERVNLSMSINSPFSS